MPAQPGELPYRLLGASGRSRLQQRLEAAARRWLDTWTSKDSVPLSIRLATDSVPLPRVLDPLAESYRISANGAAALEVRFFPRGLGAVVGLPADRVASGAGALRGLAAQLAAALLRGLVNELMDSASIAAWDFDERVGGQPARCGEHLSSQRALVAVADREIAELVLLPPLVNALAPPGGQQGKGRVEPRRAAIGKARVKVDAVLGTVELSVSDFLSLDRGDVIVLGTRLAHGCRVEVPRAAALAEAVVGRCGDRRAVRIRRAETGRANG